jgi:hypothetical protein
VPRPTKIRVEGDSAAVAAWLKNHGYPHEWVAETLASHAIKAGLWDGEYLAGYIWAVWAEDGSTLLFHGCIAPAYRGRWMSLHLLLDLEKLASFLGADALQADLPDADTARKLGRMLRRYGYTVSEDPPTIHRIIGDWHGQQDFAEAEEAQD